VVLLLAVLFAGISAAAAGISAFVGTTAALLSHNYPKKAFIYLS
jgi:hypothetical protein